MLGADKLLAIKSTVKGKQLKVFRMLWGLKTDINFPIFVIACRRTILRAFEMEIFIFFVYRLTTPTSPSRTRSKIVITKAHFLVSALAFVIVVRHENISDLFNIYNVSVVTRSLHEISVDSAIARSCLRPLRWWKLLNWNTLLQVFSSL